jgi:DHA2 family multidrug resistance protein
MGVILGPIIGPALGGWLTDDYNWRWVFYINVPFGIVSFLGVLTFLAESPRKRTRFDFFGFITLSCALGALQMLLDRGPLKDWFGATEVWIEATIAAVAFYLFAVHTATARAPPFVSPSLFRDRNFLTGNVFVFVIGVVLFATLALLPPLLQEHMGYPVFLTGLITAPRGIGTLVSMVIVGRLIGRIATRYLILFGLLATAFSLWQMSGFSLLMDGTPIVWSGFIQGVGTGFVYVPLAAVAFATLNPQLRNEATAVFNLTRNIGSSIGISVVEALLVRNTQVMHVALASHLTRYVGAAGVSAGTGIALLNARVTEQAAMIAYNDDFKLMMILTICVIPFAFLLRDVQRPKSVAMVLE